jgi:tetratricopeptide (TPR) repeat protein
MKKTIKVLNLLNKQLFLKCLFACIILNAADAPLCHAQELTPELKKTADSLFTQGKIKYNNGKYADAVKDFTYSILIDVSNVNAFLQRGFCNAILKNYNDAVGDFSEVLFYQPSHEWAFVSRGSAYNKLEQYQKAIDDFNEALKLKPDDAEAYNNRGFAKKMLGDLKGACEDWNQSKKLGNDEAKIILKNNYCK